MPKYEICIVSKEYRYIHVEAKDDHSAHELVWDHLGEHIANNTATHYDTELFTERLITEENDDA